MQGLLKQARRYQRYAMTVRMVHYHMADQRAWLNQAIGVLTVLAASLVSTGILTHVNTHPSAALTVAGGAVAFAAAVLAGLQSFYKFGEVAEKHRIAGADYGDIGKKLELFLVEHADAADAEAAQALSALTLLAAQLSELDRKGPGFPAHLFDRAARQHEAGVAGGHGGSLWPFRRRRRTRAPQPRAAGPR
jgi:hypothetical protein